jgi:putative Holliday junction resolvase
VASEARLRRLLALDVGARRIGLAVTDELGITAQGLETLQRQNKRADFARLAEIVRQYSVAEIVVGLPLHMSGTEGAQAERMRHFAHELGQLTGLPVHLVDERLTSAEANRLLRDSDQRPERSRGVVDRMAAVLILQAFLAARETT